MLPRERVVAALDHTEGDRIPWGEHFIDHNVYADILGRETLVHAKFRETRALWDGRRDEIVDCYKRDHPELIRALEMDIVPVGWAPPKGHTPAPMEQLDDETYRDAGGNIYRVSATTGNLMPYKINTDDYQPPTVEGLQEAIDTFDPDDIGDPGDSQWEVVRHAVETMGDTHFVMLLAGDVAWPTFGATSEDQWMSLVEHPEICSKLAELTGLRLAREVKLQAALGVDAIMPCGDLGSSTGLMASPELYRQMVLPVHRAHVAAAHAAGLKVLKHCCGHVWPIIDDLADTYDAYEGIQGTAGMDVADLKGRVAGRMTLWGGIWHEHIIMGTPADIRADAARAFERAAPGGGYIMGSSHSLAVGAKAENILEMKRVRDQWGTYPINPGTFT